MKTSYSRLRSGEWGVRVEGDPGELPVLGASIQVERRDGTITPATLATLVWADSDEPESARVALYAIVATRPATRRRRRWTPCGYPGCSPGYCDECDGDGLYS